MGGRNGGSIPLESDDLSPTAATLAVFKEAICTGISSEIMETQLVQQCDSCSEESVSSG
jgi:hypothetical protein